MYSNSSAADAFDMPNNASKVSTGCVHSVGGAYVPNPDNLTLTECDKVNYGATPAPDPYANVEQPQTFGTCRDGKNLSGTITATESHPLGVKSMRLCGGVTLKGNVTFAPGLYIIDGGSVDVDFTTTGNVTMAGQGVTFFLNNAQAKLNSNLRMDLSAPTTGPLAGLLFFADRADSLQHKFNGGSNSKLQGAIYAAGGSVDMIGNTSGTSGCTQIIADTISFSGNSTLQHNCEGTGTKTVGTGGKVALVE
jgi:hypothetical protein